VQDPGSLVRHGLDGAAAARKFGDQLLELPRSFADRTSISGGIEFAAAQLERAPFEATRRTIDVSGDGTNNAGRDVKLARDEVTARAVRVQVRLGPVPSETDARKSADRVVLYAMVDSIKEQEPAL